jgi:hypothetical protein
MLMRRRKTDQRAPAAFQHKSVIVEADRNENASAERFGRILALIEYRSTLQGHKLAIAANI